MVNLDLGTIRRIESCKTVKEVRKVLKDDGISIHHDDSDEVGCFSIWTDEATRIYRRNKREGFIVQGHFLATMEYSGIPVFFL